MKETAEFKLFSNCLLVKGVLRSTICDLQRNEVHFIPNNFVSAFENGPIYQGNTHSDEISSCLAYLISNDLGHFVTKNDSFPALSLEYEHPGQLSHAIILITSPEKSKTIFESISQTGVKGIDLWVMKSMSTSDLDIILESIRATAVQSINIWLPYSDSWTNQVINDLLLRMQRIYSLTLYSSVKDSIEGPLGRVLIHTKATLTPKHCGKIHTHNFSCNIRTFSESQTSNTCLNGKITITENGSIKNCPAMEQIFGNINTDSLSTIVKDDSFRRLWQISKDKIAICRDCEFRHVCTDCRAFLENPHDLFSKPLKCGYDPYTATWSEWSTNPLKEKAINYYGLEKKLDN